MNRDALASRRLRVWLPAAGVALTGTLFLLIPSEVFYSGDAGMKALLAYDFAAGNLGADLSLPGPAWLAALWSGEHHPIIDYRGAWIGEKVMIQYPIWTPLVSAPLYSAFGDRGLYVMPLLSTWWIFFAAAASCRFLRLGPAATGVALFGLIFASPITLYGLMMWEHNLAVALSLVAVLIVIRNFEAGRSARLFGAGLLLGLATLVREETGGFAVGVMVGWLPMAALRKRWREWLALGAGGAVMLSFFIGFNYFIYGRPFGLHGAGVAKRGLPDPASFFDFALRLNWEQLAHLPLLLVPLAFAVAALWRRRWDGLETLFVPLLILVGVGTAFSTAMLPIGASKDWGARFLLTQVPVLCLLAGITIQRLADHPPIAFGWKLLTFSTLAIGFGVNTLYGIPHLFDDYAHRVLPLQRAIAEDPRDVVVVSDIWVASELASLNETKHFVRVEEDRWTATLASSLHREGYEHFAYVLAEYDPHLPAPAGLAAEVSGFRIECTYEDPYGWFYHVYGCVIAPRTEDAGLP